MHGIKCGRFDNSGRLHQMKKRKYLLTSERLFLMQWYGGTFGIKTLKKYNDAMVRDSLKGRLRAQYKRLQKRSVKFRQISIICEREIFHRSAHISIVYRKGRLDGSNLVPKATPGVGFALCATCKGNARTWLDSAGSKVPSYLPDSCILEVNDNGLLCYLFLVIC